MKRLLLSATAVSLCLFTVHCGLVTDPEQLADAGSPAVDAGVQPNAQEVKQVVGASGGTVNHPSGASLVIPPGALASDVELSIQTVAPPSAEVLGGPALGSALKLGPDGTQFLLPVEVAVPFDPGLLPQGSDSSNVRVMIAPDGSTDFRQLETRADLEKKLLFASTTHFSTVAPALPPAAIFVNPSTVPAGEVGVPYSVAIRALGGTAPYTYALASGDLPAIDLNTATGDLAGVPNLGGSFTFSIRATDSSSPPLSTEKPYTLVITNPSNPVPAISLLRPESAMAGSLRDVAVTITGTGFVVGAKVFWSGSTELASTYVNATTMTCTVPASLLPTAGSFPITVVNPAPGGGSSNESKFNVNNPVPEVISVNPSTLAADGSTVQVTLTGRNFVQGSMAVIGSQGLATQFTSATQLEVIVTGNYLSADGTLQLGVFNPAPGGGYSASSATITVGTGSGGFDAGIGGDAGTGSDAGTVVTPPGALVSLAKGAPNSLAIRDGYLYFGVTENNPSAGHILRVPVTGGTPQTLATASHALHSVATDGTHVYFAYAGNFQTGYTGGFVSKVPLTGGAQTVIASNQSQVFDLEVDATHVYFTSKNNEIRRVPKNGGTVEVVTTGPNNTFNLGLNGSELLFTAGQLTDGGIYATALTAGSTATPRATVHNAHKLAVWDGYVYFTDLQRVLRVPASGGTATPLTGAMSNVTGITVDGSGVYFAGDFKMNHLAHGTWALTVVHSGLNHSPDHPVTDATHVYWAHNSDPGAIWRAGKPQSGTPSTDGGTGDFDAGIEPFDAGTGGSDAGTNPSAPVITVIDPDSAAQYSANSTHVVNGSGFGAGCDAYANGTTWLPGTVLSATQLQITVNSNLKQVVGSIGIEIDCGVNGRSNASAITVFATTVPTPVLDKVLPPSTPVDATSTTLKLYGSNFVNGAVVKYGPVPLTTTFVNAGYLTAVMTDTAHPPVTGSNTLIVENPGAVASNGLSFEITAAGNPVPFTEPLAAQDASATVGGADKIIKILGANFIPASVARIGGTNITTSYAHDGQLVATIPASMLAQAGTLTLDVFNPGPGGGASGTQPITVTASNPLPVLSSIYPAQVRAGSQDIVITASCSSLAPAGVEILIDGIPVPTTRNAESSLRFTMPAAKMASVGTVRVEVQNPAPGGGKSSAQLFNVVSTGNVVPTITSLSPASIARSTTGTTVVVNGTGFVSSSVTQVLFDGMGLSKVINTATKLTITLNSLQNATAGSFPIVVLNNGPGGGSSAPAMLTITGNNPTPVITSVAPSALGAGTADYRIAIKGSDFLRHTAVTASDGQSTTALGYCSFQIQGECSVVIPASLMTTARPLTLTLTNPAPGGGSATTTLDISGNPTPQIGNITPYRLSKNGGDQTISVTGSGFHGQSVVVEESSGTTLATTFVSTTQLSAVVPASLTTAVGNLLFKVTTPGPGGGTTVTRSISVVAVPQLTSISPSTVTAGSGTFTLTINGTDLDQPGFPLVRLGTNTLMPATTGASWTVTVDAAYIATPGTLDVSVFFEGNPDSNKLPLTIQ